MKKILLIMAVLLVLPSTASATDYYVTQNGGGNGLSEGSPMSVSQFNALRGTGYAGDTFYFSGTFLDNYAEINVGISGTPGNYVTLDGYQADKYNAVTNTPSSGIATLNRRSRSDIIDPEHGVQYLIIQDFKVQNGGNGVMLEENYYVIVRRCRFEESVEGDDWQGERAIMGYKSDHLTIGGTLGNTEDGNYIYHWGCRVNDYEKCTGDYATRFNRCDHIEFRYNYILDSQNGFGWEFTAQYWLAEYNYIEETDNEDLAILREGGITGKEGSDGIIRFNKIVGKDGGVDLGSNAARLYVYGNYIQDTYEDNTYVAPGICNPDYGSTWACDGVDEGPFYFWANIIDGGNQYGLLTGTISSGTIDTVTVHFLNNVIYNIDTYDSPAPNSNYDSIEWTGFVSKWPTVDSSFINNILLDNHEPGYNTAQAYIKNGDEGGIDINYNLYYLTGQPSDPGSINYRGSTQTVANVENHGRYGNPNFVNHVDGNFILNPGSSALTGGDSAVGGFLDTITIIAGDGISRQYPLNSEELLNPATTDWSTFPPTVNVVNKMDTAYPNVQGAYAYMGDEPPTCPGYCCILPQVCPPESSLGTYQNCPGTCCSVQCQDPQGDSCSSLGGSYCCSTGETCSVATIPGSSDCADDKCCPGTCIPDNGPEGPVGHWTFDPQDIAGDTVLDISGNGNHCTIYGGVSPVGGVFGDALDFGGSGDYLDCGNDPSLAITGDITIAAWFNVRSTAPTPDIVTKGAWNQLYSTWLSNDKIGFGINAEAFRTDPFIVPDTWYHFAAVREGSSVRIYVDGKENFTGSSSSTISTETDSLTMSTTVDPLNGLLDDVRLYDRALSLGEIQDIYEGTPTPPPITQANYSVIKTLFPPSIDSNLEEFSGANQITLINHTTGTTGAYRLMWDENALYVSAQFSDSKLNADPTHAEDGALWNDDSLEIMFDINNEGGGSPNLNDYKFFVNPLDIKTDSRGYDSSWDSGMEFAAAYEGTVNQNSDPDTGYVVEVAIPWQDWGIPVPDFGSVWGMNVQLSDFDGSGGYFTPWSQSGLDVNSPDGWNNMLFTVRADTSGNGCIEQGETVSFIDHWKYDSTGYPMREMMEAVVLYYSPGDWC